MAATHGFSWVLPGLQTTPAEGSAAVRCRNPPSSSNAQHMLDAAGQQVLNYQWLIYGVIEHEIGSRLLFHIFEYGPASEAMV